MELRITPRLKDNWQTFDDAMYRLTLDGYPVHDILSGARWHSPAILHAAALIDALPQQTDKEKFEFLAIHQEKLPPGVQLVE